MARGLMNGLVNGDAGEHDDGDEVRRRDGSIVRIKMKNFITYDSVECTPGESLNVVIGPNGTGKSTILSAIVLGLGGKPLHLGKSNTPIQDFIKNHCQEAQIEIELLRQRRNTVIKRTIMKDGKSIYNLNGRQVALKEIEAETKALNIQIDNLCQVLAQDRVQDFAKLNKQELLEATQKAVGKEGMAEVHIKLKDLQRLQKQLETQILSDKKQRDIEQGHVDRLKGAVEKLERRRGIEAEADACRLKLKIINYKKKKDEVDRYKLMKRKAEEEVNRIKALIEPFEQQIKKAEKECNAVKNKQNGMDRKIRNQQANVSEARNKLETLREAILELEVDLEKQLKSAETQKQKEDEVRQTISKLRNDISSQESISADQIEAKAALLRAEVEKLASALRRMEPQKSQIEQEIYDLNGQKQDIHRQIARLENHKEMRLKMLQEVNNQAYQAAMWVDSNRHLFERPVYLPMIVELDVNPAYAKYAENAIGYQDLVAIICESKNDMKLVVDNCRKRMNLKVNVLQADPDCQPFMPRMNLDELRRHFPGFEGYLINFVKGPNTLLNFLCQRKNFHNIPVASTDVEASETFSLYYSGDYRKGHSKSRYRTDLIFFSDSIQSSRFFKAVASDVDEDSLRSREADIQSRIDSKNTELATKKQEMNTISQRREQAREEQKKLRQTQTTIEAMKFRLSRKEKELNQMERNRFDPDNVRRQHAAKVKATVLDLVAAQEPLYEALKQLDALVVQNQLVEFEVQAAKAAVSNSKRLCKAEQEALQNAEAQAEGINNTLADTRTEASNQANSIQREYKKNVAVLWNENEALFSTLPNSIEELETHIEDKTAHAQMLGGGNDGDTVRQFEGHLKKLESLNVTIKDKESQANDLTVDMETRENQWKTELNELVDAISTNFSRYFREMKCVGQVELFTGNSEHDYDNYGLRLRVKFRDEEELQDLNAHTQSGGERAVSTAIYMLSLQELTPAPFRLVDEINQGMDSNNERRVYELLLQSTSRPGTPQYFLLTPKLLTEMKYNPGTTVLCVMNSACAPNHKTWDMKKFIELRKRLGSNGRNYSCNTEDVEMEDDD